MHTAIVTTATAAFCLATATLSQAKVIGFEASEGYTANAAVVGQPNPGSKWSVSNTLMRVVAGAGNPGNAIRSVAPDAPGTETPTLAGFNHVQYTIGADDFGGNEAPKTNGFQGKIEFSFDLAVNTALDTTATDRVGFIRFGSDDVEFFLLANGKLEVRSRLNDADNNFIAKTAEGADFDFDTYGIDSFVTIRGVADYATDTFTLFVNDVQQSHPTHGTNIVFRNGSSAANAFDHLRYQNNVATNHAGYRQVTLDNLSFALVPEPASAAVWGLVGGLGLLARRRTR